MGELEAGVLARAAVKQFSAVPLLLCQPRMIETQYLNF